MRLSAAHGLAVAKTASIVQLWPVLMYIVPLAQGVNFDPVPVPDLSLSQLGRVAITGDFDAITLYTYKQQNEDAYSTNGSQSLLTQMPNGAFATLDASDASIVTMCPFVLSDGTLSGVVVGGNFTSLGGIETQGIALVDPVTAKITALTGLTGSVSAVICDQDTNTVYVGGDFKGGNSTNAIAWVGTAGWTNLPFAGFNGPVLSIAKAPNGNVIFGGSFTGLGNTTTPTKKDEQVVNLSSANISSGSSAAGTDSRNIICNINGTGGSTSSWLLDDNTPGFWRADMSFGYQPTKLRIRNTHQDGRGTKTFRFTAIPLKGIMNLTYTDPATGINSSCDARCPLSNDTSVQYQDFHFVNVVGMNGFRIDVSEWYGPGGGLDGIELFQDDIYAYAVSDLNEPACANVPFGSNSTATGPWAVTPSGASDSNYLTANLVGQSVTSNSASVVFKPDIKQPGNYSVTVYTPGCKQDQTCPTRGIVNITGVFATGTKATSPIQTTIYQTNKYDKYDQVYFGYVDANSDSFRPTVTLTPASGQGNGINVVAQRVRFQLTNSTGGLNSIFEYNPNQAVVNTDFSNSTYDQAGMNLDAGAVVTSLAVLDSTTYVAGNFSANGFKNIFAISRGNYSSLPDGGLNAQISSTYVYEDLLYLGGNFTNTTKDGPAGLNNVAAFNHTAQAWQALGAGVNGRVNWIVPLLFNISNGQPETCISVNGNFDQIVASGSNTSYPVDGIAIWVPSRRNWVQNLDLKTVSVRGQLSSATNVSGSNPLLAGSVPSGGQLASDAVELTSNNGININPLSIQIMPRQLTRYGKKKRAVSGQNVTGVVTGLFYNGGGRNVTILGGHFTATAANGSTINNLAFLNGTQGSIGAVTGIGNQLDENSVFLALATQGDILYAGGTISGQVDGASVHGLILYDLAAGNFASPQPPAFAGSDVAVNAISIRPGTGEVYVAGNFDTAGSLPCPSVCNFNNGQWNRPGSGISGSVGALGWQGNSGSTLLAGGNLTVNNNATSLASYDTRKQQWSALNGAASAVPGPVTALSPANNDASSFWVAGKSSNGSAFLMKYDGSSFQTVGDVLSNQTTIRGLSVLGLNSNHRSTDLVPADQVLLVTGQLYLPQFGNASAALFNGTTFSPFLLSTSGNAPGSISQLFSEKQMIFKPSGGHIALGFIVLVGLACTLGVIFLIVVIGISITMYRRRKAGYVPAPTNYFEKTSNMGRIPPEHLFGSLGRNARNTSGPPVL